MSQPNYAPMGHFCWPELATRGLGAARAFYSELLGWSFEEVPSAVGPYMIFQVGGLPAAGGYEIHPERTAQPRWNSYVAVPSADKAARKAEKLGGRILMAPFDVEGIGRMAVIQDPGGARFCLWQSLSQFGAGVFGKPGALSWTELATRDPEGALVFYGGLFGWEGQVKEEGAFSYTELWLDGTAVGGIVGMEGQAWAGMPEQWTPYFAVDDCDARARAAARLGAEILAQPTDIPEVGRFATLKDPQGALFSLIALLDR